MVRCSDEEIARLKKAGKHYQVEITPTKHECSCGKICKTFKGFCAHTKAVEGD